MRPPFASRPSPAASVCRCRVASRPLASFSHSHRITLHHIARVSSHSACARVYVYLYVCVCVCTDMYVCVYCMCVCASGGEDRFAMHSTQRNAVARTDRITVLYVLQYTRIGSDRIGLGNSMGRSSAAAAMCCRSKHTLLLSSRADKSRQRRRRRGETARTRTRSCYIQLQLLDRTAQYSTVQWLTVRRMQQLHRTAASAAQQLSCLQASRLVSSQVCPEEKRRECVYRVADAIGTAQHVPTRVGPRRSRRVESPASQNGTDTAALHSSLRVQADAHTPHAPRAIRN